MSTKRCVFCDGAGEVTHPRDEWRHPNDPDVQVVTCPRCGGTGDNAGEVASR